MKARALYLSKWSHDNPCSSITYIFVSKTFYRRDRLFSTNCIGTTFFENRVEDRGVISFVSVCSFAPSELRATLPPIWPKPYGTTRPIVPMLTKRTVWLTVPTHRLQGGKIWPKHPGHEGSNRPGSWNMCDLNSFLYTFHIFVVPYHQENCCR